MTSLSGAHPMNIEIKDKAEITLTISIEGNINLYEVYKFKEKIMDFLRMDYKEIILDLSKITLIDSSGIGALISLTKTAKEKNINFCLKNPSENITQIMNLLKVNDTLILK